MPSAGIFSPGPHDEEVADLDTAVGNGQVGERADRLPSTATSASLEEAAEEDERRDHTCDLEVRVRAADEDEPNG